MSAIIDIWDISTFDQDILKMLRDNASLLRSYAQDDAVCEAARREGNFRRWFRGNRHAQARHALLEGVSDALTFRTIRAWHFTRLTDGEVEQIRRSGMYLSTPQTLRDRLRAQVLAGTFSSAEADELYRCSPFSSDQYESRLGKLWMSSHPVDVSDGDVEMLLKYWGGESVYFHLGNVRLKVQLRKIGAPRVIELAVPLNITSQTSNAAESIVSTFERILMVQPHNERFDMYSFEPVAPSNVLAVHSAGEVSFSKLGKTYPDRFQRYVSW